MRLSVVRDFAFTVSSKFFRRGFALLDKASCTMTGARA
jgi:hypothetical protein